jgi:hypothetical protein
MKKVIFVFATILFSQLAYAQDKIVVLCQQIVCKSVDDGPVGSRDGEELFGYLRCGISTSARPVTASANGVPTVSGSPVVFSRNSTHNVQLRKGQKFDVNESRTFELKSGEANSAVIILNGDLDELDGDGVPDDVSNFLNKTPLGSSVPVAAIARIFHRDANDKLEKYKADERIRIPFNSLPAKGETREYIQRFGSGGTNVVIYWYIMRV